MVSLDVGCACVFPLREFLENHYVEGLKHLVNVDEVLRMRWPDLISRAVRCEFFAQQ